METAGDNEATRGEAGRDLALESGDDSSRLELDALVRRSLDGDIEALERIIAVLQNDVFNLALKFLWHPQDAEDATQEILLKIILNLNRFEFRSSLRTYAYRIAANYLSDARRGRAERAQVSFDSIAHELQAGSRAPDFEDEVETAELAEQVKTACTHAMLLALDRESRLVFILGEVIQVSGPEAAYILDISADAYRQRLSRTRKRMETFMRGHCGLMNEAAACRCENRIDYARNGAGLPYVAYAEHMHTTEPGFSIPRIYQDDADRVHRMALIYRTNRSYRSPERILKRIKALVHKDG